MSRPIKTRIGRPTTRDRTLLIGVSQPLAAIYNRMSDGIIFCDGRGMISFFNRSAKDLLYHIAPLDLGQPLSRYLLAASRLLQSGVGNGDLSLIATNDEGAEISFIGSIESSLNDGEEGFNIIFRPAIKDVLHLRAPMLLAAIVESSDDVVIGKTLDGVITAWNKDAERLFGYSAAEIIGQNISKLIAPGHENEEPEIVDRLRKGEQVVHFDTVYEASDGTLIDVSLSISPIINNEGQIVGASQIAHDIGDRKRATAAHETMEQRMSLAIDAAQMGIWDWDLQAEKLEWSVRFANLFGTELLSGTFESFEKCIHPADREIFRHNILEALQTHSKYHDEYRVAWHDGSVRWIEARGQAIYNSDGTGRRMTGVVIDITEGKVAQETIRVGEQRLQLAAEAAKIGFWDWDLKTGKITRSSLLAEIVGSDGVEDFYDPEAVDYHPDDRRIVRAKMRDAIQSGGGYNHEFRIIWPDGSTRWLEGRGRAIYNERNEPIRMLGTVVDITDRKNSEEASRLRDAEIAHLSRVSTMGNMASSLAHELNQPLGAILNYTGVCANLARIQPIQSDKLLVALDEVMNETRRASAIIGRLRAFVSKQAPKSALVDLNEIVCKVIAFMGFELRHEGVTVNVDCKEGLRAVMADAIQIEQVLVNLVYNAMQAMAASTPAQRRLNITTSLIDAGFAQVNVIDSGPGMPKVQLARLFEPFFTTKSQGLGMGLNISRSIIEHHGGRLVAALNESGGMRFSFTLPTEVGLDSCNTA